MADEPLEPFEAFEPTAYQRQQAEAMSGLGLTQEQISLIIGVSPKTLRKHFGTELKRGDANATAKVAAALFKRATSTEGKDGIAAAIFWMKVRAKWSERPRDPDDGAPPAPISAAASLDQAPGYVLAPDQATSMEAWTEQARQDLAARQAEREAESSSGLPSPVPSPSS